MGYDVIAVDTGADKQKLCQSLGADHFIDFKTAVRSVYLWSAPEHRLGLRRFDACFYFRTSSMRSTS